MIERTAMLGMTRMIDFANQADVSLTVNMDMPQVVAFKAGFLVLGIRVRERGIDGYAMNGAGGSDLMSKFSMLDSKLYGGREGGGRCRWGNLWVRKGSHLSHILFYVIDKLRHMHLIEDRCHIFLNFLLDST